MYQTHNLRTEVRTGWRLNHKFSKFYQKILDSSHIHERNNKTPYKIDKIQNLIIFQFTSFLGKVFLFHINLEWQQKYYYNRLRSSTAKDLVLTWKNFTQSIRDTKILVYYCFNSFPQNRDF